MNFSAIVARFAPPPPSVAKIAAAAGQSTIKLAITRDWKHAMELIAERLDAAHSERTRLIENRSALLLDAVQGEPGADARLAKVEREIADIDRQIAQLRDANVLARERDDAEKAAAAAATYAHRKSEWTARNGDVAQLAADVDSLAVKLGTRYAELRKMIEQQVTSCPVPIDGALGTGGPLDATRVESVILIQLALAGLRGAWRYELPWKDFPTAAGTVSDGIAWVNLRLEQAEHRKNAADSAA